MFLSWEHWNETGGPKYPHEKVVQFCFRTYRPEQRAQTRALDLGCGSGVHCVFLASEGFQVVGVDASSTGITNTKNKLDALGLHADVHLQSIDVLDFPDGRFDLVICTNVLDSAGPSVTRHAIARLPRVMDTSAHGLFLFASERDFRTKGETPYSIYGYQREEVEQLFAVGFSQVWIDSYITTYQGGEIEQHDWLVTVEK
jgi:cyclopropane fatty-acyl-phospholipid synthase-like methyltransferase